MSGAPVRFRAGMNAWGPVAAGLCATLVGVGLQRFAYAPLLPAMVQAAWLSPGDAGTLGAANFAGYLIGAGIAPTVGRRLGLRPALRGAMLVAAVCFALCAWRGGLGWFAPWRTVAGIAGGVLMVLAGPAVLSAVPAAMRGGASGLMFVGVGLGIATGAVIVPAMLPAGLSATWLMLAAITLLLAVVSWRYWPDVAPPAAARAPRLRGAMLRLVLAYTLGGVAATPHMGWLPDFVARGLGRGTAAGAAFWLLYGAAVATGAALSGPLAARLGTARLFRAILWVQVAGLAVPLLAQSLPAMLLSTVLAGATTVSLTALALTRARELAGDAAPGIWRISTVGWAAAQTGSGFLLAWIYAATGSHLPLFAVGLAAAIAAVLIRP